MKLRRWSQVAATAVCLGSSMACAQQSATPAAANRPRVEVSEESFDFGYVPQGATISHVFWLKNTGGDTLRINDVRTG